MLTRRSEIEKRELEWTIIVFVMLYIFKEKEKKKKPVSKVNKISTFLAIDNVYFYSFYFP